MAKQKSFYISKEEIYNWTHPELFEKSSTPKPKPKKVITVEITLRELMEIYDGNINPMDFFSSKLPDNRSYQEKLKDPLWKAKRRELLENKCNFCSETNNLELHHKYYEDGLEPWEYPDDAYLTLCRKCHQKEYEQMVFNPEHYSN